MLQKPNFSKGIQGVESGKSVTGEGQREMEVLKRGWGEIR